MKPTIGRIVHYYPHSQDTGSFPYTPGEPVAAIITQVHSDECVNLRLFVDGQAQGETWITSVVYDEGQGEFSWSWPPRV